MLLGMYLGSTAYVIRKILKFIKNSREKLIEEGYSFVKTDPTNKDIIYILLAVGVILCPGLNLVIPYHLAKGGAKGYDMYKKELLKSGQIVNVNEKIMNRINSDYLVKADYDIMKTMLIPEEVVQLRKSQQKNNFKENERQDTHNRFSSYSFSDYLLMEQQFESDEKIERGNAYKKTL